MSGFKIGDVVMVPIGRRDFVKGKIIGIRSEDGFISNKPSDGRHNPIVSYQVRHQAPWDGETSGWFKEFQVREYSGK